VALASVSGHMRIADPPGRASLYWYPEFAYLDPVLWVLDDAMWCGNVRQYENDTRCGVCGDPSGEIIPRSNEYRGRYWRDVKVRTYTAGQTIPVTLDFTAPHGGRWEVQLCDRVPETEDCFRSMELGNGKTYWDFELGEEYPQGFTTTAKLPESVRCESCVVRAHWRCIQHWGTCDASATCECIPDSGNPPGGMGCGEQQTFRACADVQIL